MTIQEAILEMTQHGDNSVQIGKVDGGNVIINYYNTDGTPGSLNLFYIDKDYIKSKLLDKEESVRYYASYLRVSDDIDVLSKIVCNNLDVPNEEVLLKANEILGKNFAPLFITGNGGQGKTSTMFRFAIEKAQEGFPVFWSRLQSDSVNQSTVNTMITNLECISKKYGIRVFLFIDNPYANEKALSMIHNRIGLVYKYIQVVLIERLNRLEILLNRNDDKLKHWRNDANIICLLKPESDENDFIKELKNCEVLPPTKAWKHKVVAQLKKALIDSGKYNAKVLQKIIQSQEKKIANENIAIVDNIFHILHSYQDAAKKFGNAEVVSKSGFKMDWDEWEEIIKSHCSFDFSYAYIACLYLYKIPMTVELLSKLIDVREIQINNFLRAKFTSSMGEPLHYSDGVLWPKHDMMADIFFSFNKEPSVQTCLEGLIPLMDTKMLIELSAKLFTKNRIFNIIRPYCKKYDKLEYDRLVNIYRDHNNISDISEDWMSLRLSLAEYWYHRSKKNNDKAKIIIDDTYTKHSKETVVKIEYALFYLEYGDADKIKAPLYDLISGRASTSATQYEGIFATIIEGSLSTSKSNEVSEIIKNVLEQKPSSMVLWSIAKVLSEAEFITQYSDIANIVLQKIKKNPNYPYYSSRINKFCFKADIESQNPEMSAESFKMMIDNSSRIANYDRKFLFDGYRLGQGQKRTMFEQFVDLCVKKGKKDIAMSSVKYLIENHAANKMCNMIATEMAFMMHEYDLAFQAVNKLARKGKDIRNFSQFLYETGSRFFKKRQYEYAAFCFEKHLAKNKKDVYCLNNLGELYAETGNFCKAKKYYNMSLSVSPDGTYALIGSAQTDVKFGKITDETKERVNRAYEVCSDNIPALGQIASLYKSLNEPTIEEKCYLKILEINTTDDRAICDLFNFYYYSNRREEAKKVLDTYPDVKSKYIDRCRNRIGMQK